LRPVRQGQAFDLDRMLVNWVGLGFENASVVEAPGQFSRRGGIVDIWPPNVRRPVRIELFGDEVDSLRTFDPSTQRTLERIASTAIGPASEALPRIGERVIERLAGLDLAACHPPARVEFEREIENLRHGSGFRNLEWYIPYLYSQPGSLVDYLPAQDAWLMVEDAGELLASLADLEGQAEQLGRDLKAAGDIPPVVAPPYFPGDALIERLAAQPVIHFGRTTLGANGAPREPEFELGRHFTAGPRFGGQVRAILTEVESPLRRGDHLVMVSRQAPRLAELLRESGHTIVPVENIAQPPPPGLTLVQGVMEEGWRLEGDGVKPGGPGAGEAGDARGGLWFLTDAELFGWGKPKPRRPQRPRAVAPEVFFADVQTGDYVVHLEHGIGQFQGLIKMAVDGVEREYLRVEYAQGDQLYVPVHQADRLARYVGAGDVTPSLHRLGTADWEQVKARARRAVAEIADDLLELYAAREVVQGHAFSPDATWQHELESSFPYVETEDQLVAVEAVKHDMEQPRPMDRLICGDVGYGKTEVAIRAAFKVIVAGKQVAILVPTTILALQHYNTFKERFAPFPIKVEQLSRFKGKTSQKKVVEGITDGSIEMVIGTHRLLQSDIKFKDLGLLIIDEEQRFGVEDKEKIKRLKENIDVLTLTATPIPRTLEMALTGVREISQINSSPEGRKPVKTYVQAYSETAAKEAIEIELARGGQVYYVNNRIQGLGSIMWKLKKIVPNARIAIAHGQMDSDELEDIMLSFYKGEIDVLLCTTIIESGLDIPTANTIIVENAQNLGLAQMYQLRGRVGRSEKRAYAYFFYNSEEALTETARMRLEAIRDFVDLGAGLKIAMRDLEIRGAGNMLGAEQSGHIAAVGYDLYLRLLEDAKKQLQKSHDGKPMRPEAPPQECNVDLRVSGFIPEHYVPDEALRIDCYQRLVSAETIDQVKSIEHELQDRFGRPPPEVESLYELVKIRVLAQSMGINSIVEDNLTLNFHFGPNVKLREDFLDRLVARFGERTTVRPNMIRIRKQRDNPVKLAREFIELACED